MKILFVCHGQMYILAYDFGTGGIKASLYGADGTCVASGFDAYETSYPASGFHEQAPEDWWRATVRRLLADKLGEWRVWFRRNARPR